MDQTTLSFFGTIRRAVVRARFHIMAVGIIYVLSAVIGSLLVHQGSQFALEYRDRLVGQALGSDPAAIALKEGQPLKAAFLDFGRNLVMGAIPQTITGLTVVSPYGFAAYRGWVGGIVSVDRHHRSRFAETKQALYLIGTLILQLIPYTLAGGVGVKLGMSYFKKYPEYLGQKRWLGYPIEAIRDVGRIYVLIVPLFFVASLWEFLSPWN